MAILPSDQWNSIIMRHRMRRVKKVELTTTEAYAMRPSL
jgi:hypothetical protein